MKRVMFLLVVVMGLSFLASTTVFAVERERNGFFLRPVGTYSGMITSTEDLDVGGGLGGGLVLGGNFARGWVCGIQGGVTYTSYSAESSIVGVNPPDKMEVIDMFFGGIFGGSIGPVDLYANIGTDMPLINFDGWDFYEGIKVGGGVDVWIVDWLAVGVSGDFIWAYSVGDAYSYDYSGSGSIDFDHMSRYSILFGPKFKF